MNSGVYAILNVLNDKVYVGSAVDLSDRFRLHLLHINRGSHHNRHLQKAWLKYGAQAFVFVVIEYTDWILEREQHWIKELNTTNIEKGYNICAVARNRKGVKASKETREKLRLSHLGKKASDETKKKMSEQRIGNTVNNGRKWSQDTIDKRSKSNTGRKRSEEAKARMALAQKNRNPVSTETRLKMSIAAKNRRKSVDNFKSVWE